MLHHLRIHEPHYTAKPIPSLTSQCHWSCISLVSHASSYLRFAVIVQSQRIGSDQRLVHKNQSSVIRPYPSRLHNSSNVSWQGLVRATGIALTVVGFVFAPQKITEQGMEPSDATFEAHCLLARIYCDQVRWYLWREAYASSTQPRECSVASLLVQIGSKGLHLVQFSRDPATKSVHLFELE